MKEITKETYLQWFEQMSFWRRFEDTCRSMYCLLYTSDAADE